MPTTTTKPPQPWQQEPDSSTLAPELNTITRPLMLDVSALVRVL